MKDRLIELLDGYYEESGTCFVHYFTEDESKMLADYLFENGVIASPCKLGDEVYYYKAELNEICPAKVIGVFNNYYTPSMPLWITIEYESKLISRQEEKMMSNVFKLLCRYTKEEAEKAFMKR